LLAGERPEIPGTVKRWVRDLINRAWQTDARARPSFAEIDQELRRNGLAIAREGVDIEKVGAYLGWIRAGGK